MVERIKTQHSRGAQPAAALPASVAARDGTAKADPAATDFNSAVTTKMPINNPKMPRVFFFIVLLIFNFLVLIVLFILVDDEMFFILPPLVDFPKNVSFCTFLRFLLLSVVRVRVVVVVVVVLVIVIVRTCVFFCGDEPVLDCTTIFDVAISAA